MSSKYTFSENDHLYFVSFAVVNWVDAFTRREYKDIIVNSLKYCQQKKGLELYAWVVTDKSYSFNYWFSYKYVKRDIRDMKKHTSSKLKMPLTVISKKAGKNG